MRTFAIVQARMGSARLPGKALMPISGRPMLAHVLERAGAVAGLEGVVLVTSVNERDDPIADLGLCLGLALVYRGDEHDVLSRYAHAALFLNADRVMRITGDCPLLCADVCEDVLAMSDEFPSASFVSNDTLVSGYPDGTDCELFSRELLVAAHDSARHHSDREHVTSWMRRHATCLVVPSEVGDWRSRKWSVDCAADLERVRNIYGHLPAGAYNLRDALAAEVLATQQGGEP